MRSSEIQCATVRVRLRTLDVTLQLVPTAVLVPERALETPLPRVVQLLAAEAVHYVTSRPLGRAGLFW